MSDIIMLLNVLWGRKEQDVYNAVQKDFVHILKEAPVDAIFATTNNKNPDFIHLQNITLCGVGVITNSKELYTRCGIKNITQHPYEIIIHLYVKYGIQYTLNIIQGYVSFILLDFTDMESYPMIYVARDPLGITPLWILKENANSQEGIVAVSSNELYVRKILDSRKQNKYNENLKVTQFSPGCFACYTHSEKTCTQWVSKENYIQYYTYPMHQYISMQTYGNVEITQHHCILHVIRYFKSYMIEYKKYIDTLKGKVYVRLDGDIASMITLMIAKLLYKNSINTYTCGPIKAPWFKKAKEISKMFSTDHIEIAVLNSVPALNTNEINVMSKEKLEGYITAQHLSKYTDAKCVILPIGANMWQNSNKDMFMRNKKMRENMKTYISSKVGALMNEFWKKNINTCAPFIDRKIIEIIATLGIDYNMHAEGTIQKLAIMLGADSMLNDKPEVVDQSIYWSKLNKVYENKLPCVKVLHTKTNNVLLYC